MGLDQLSLPPPDLMKIDVEDHEQAVFEGGREMLVKHHPLILFECRGDRVGSAAGAVLCSLGYRLFAMRWQSENDPMIELAPVSAEALSSLGQTNVVAVTEADRGRWFG